MEGDGGALDPGTDAPAQPRKARAHTLGAWGIGGNRDDTEGIHTD